MSFMTHHSPATTDEITQACRDIHDSGLDRIHYLLVHVCSFFTLSARLAIIQTYREIYNEDMILTLSAKFKFSDDIFYCLTLWFTNQHARDAIIAWQSLNLNMECGADYTALVEIFVCRKSSHFLMIKQAYTTRYGRYLEQDVTHAEPPSPLQTILMALAASHNAHHEDASQDIAKCDAKRLFETGEGKSGGLIDKAIVVEIFCKRSIPQLKLTFSRYRLIYGHSYMKILKKKNCGEFENGLKMVIECMCNTPKYYAKLLRSRVRGSSSDKNILARIVASRVEVDMNEIQKVYDEKYGVTLLNDISRRMAKDDFRDFVVGVLSKTNLSS